jgi:XTP/dITP diphosphohydrolase
MLRRLVIATHNAKKAAEMRQILGELLPRVELATLADFPGAEEPEETGGTYAENASLKSEAAARHTGQWCVADDAGLEIDALEGAPGLYSKRFGGEDLPFPQKMRLILERLEGMAPEKRTARFRCCVALSSPGPTAPYRRVESLDEGLEPQTWVVETTCEGQIAAEPKGAHGFGYDPIFFLPHLGRHMAELTPEEKHAVSHRGKALNRLRDELARAGKID